MKLLGAQAKIITQQRRLHKFSSVMSGVWMQHNASNSRVLNQNNIKIEIRSIRLDLSTNSQPYILTYYCLQTLNSSYSPQIDDMNAINAHIQHSCLLLSEEVAPEIGDEVLKPLIWKQTTVLTSLTFFPLIYTLLD